jgi:hypothetical protein
MMFGKFSLAIILLAACASGLHAAEPAGFISPPARRAQDAYAASISKAESDYKKALIAADEQYLKDLKDSLDQAMKNKNLDESNRIDTAIKKVQADLAQRRTKAAAVPPVKADPRVGAWRISKADGSGAFVIVLSADNSAAARNGSRGTWKAENRQLVIQWTNGSVDTFDLSDHDELAGKNNSGIRLKLVRTND